MKPCLISGCQGSALVESVFVFPLFFVMLLGFVDLSTWTSQKIRLWNLGRDVLHQAARARFDSTAACEQFVVNRLSSHVEDIEVEVQYVPSLIKLKAQPALKEYNPVIIVLMLKRNISHQGIVLKWLFGSNPLTLEFRLYEMQSHF